MPGRFANLEFDTHEPGTESFSVSAATEPSARDHLGAARQAEAWTRYEPALRLYTRALQDDRTLIPAWVGQVQMLVELDEWQEARVWSDKALQLFTGNGELLAAKAQACQRVGDQPAAMESSDGAMSAAGSSPWRWIVRGELMLARGRSFADDCFSKALAEPAADWLDSLTISRICRYYRRPAAALRYSHAALGRAPTEGALWLEVGACQRELGMRDPAANSFRRSLDLCPRSPEAAAALQALETGTLRDRLRGWWRRWRRR